MALTDKLVAIADAIRGKTGKADSLTLDQMPIEIEGIQVGGGEPSNIEVQWIAAIERGDAQVTSLPEGLTSIAESAFEGYKNVALTSLPSGVTSIGASAFRECTSLALTSLPDGLTSIADTVFYDCKNITITSIPDGVTSIGDYAFWRCTNLRNLTLPSGLTSIGGNAFSRCENLSITSIPSGVTSIGANAFYVCPGLTEITFEGKPTGTIHTYAFRDCPNLLTINVPWAEGEVANAPWSATNATINYNYTGG